MFQKLFYYLFAILCLYIIFIIIYLSFEHKFIYPGPQTNKDTKILKKNNLEFIEQRFFQFKQHKIEFFQKERFSKNNILVLSGNAEDNFYVTQHLTKIFIEHNIYGLNYLGYGESEGTPNEKNISDLIKYFVEHKKLNEQPLIIIGRSLGTGFATKLNSELSNVSKLILISPYYSMDSLAKFHVPAIPNIIIDKFMTNQIKTFTYASKIKNPTYVLYTENDSVIPKENTELLLTHFLNQKSYKIQNTDHGEILYNQQTEQILKNIIQD